MNIITNCKDVEVHEKGWGREIWCYNGREYCSKVLVFDKIGASFSFHYHLKKTETWYVGYGVFKLDYYDLTKGKENSIELRIGDIVTIFPGEPHKLTAIGEVPGYIFEASTQHFEDDSYRIAPGDSQKVQRVFTNGCFDLIHSGHIRLLTYCKTLGRVIVGLNSDSSVKRLKGEGRPIKTEEERKEILEALSCVDEVYIFDENTPFELIKHLKPNILVKGGDYKLEDIVGIELVDKVILFPYVEGHSTTNTIKVLKDRNNAI